MNKKLIIMLLVLVVFLSGCLKLFQEDTPIENTTVVEEHPGKPENMLLCELSYVDIYKVDSINTNNCLTLINLTNTTDEANLLRNSFQYSGRDQDEIALEMLNKTCEETENLGGAYCLKDNSTCLIGDGRTCIVITLYDIPTMNQTNTTSE